MPAPRKPTQILSLTGRLAHDKKRYRNRKDEPTENGPLGDPAPHLPPTERELWKEIAGLLVPGVALASDRLAFEGLVRMAAKLRDNTIGVGERTQLFKMFERFGMTPADRSRVSVAGQGGKKNPFAGLGGTG